MKREMTGARDGRSGPEGPGRRHGVRLSRRRGAADLRRDLPAERHPPHPRAPRAGRGPRRRGLRPLDRQARRRPRHLRPRRHQRRHRHDRRADGLDPDRRPHRPGPDLHDRQRRLPGGRHRRHHPPLHQAQLAGQGHRASSPRPSTRPSTSRPTAAPARCSSTSPRTSSSPPRAYTAARGGAHLALPAADQGRPGRHPRRRRGAGAGRAPDPLLRRRRHQLRPRGQPRSCASSPTRPASRSPRR